jgi:nucleoside phosphorylase
MDVELALIEDILNKIYISFLMSYVYNIYILNKIGGYNIIMTVIFKIGNNITTVIITQLFNDSSSIRFSLLVGIGGGIFSAINEPDIYLKDVIIS